MDEENKIPVLFELLFGEGAPHESMRGNLLERLWRWAAAFEGWLDERRALKPSTIKTARLAWRRFLRQCGKMPWEVQAGDIEGHAKWMLREGYSPNTTYSAQGMILDFYKWCSERIVDPECEADFNPGAGVRRHRVRRCERAQVLSREEVGALLRLMRRDESPVGKRDYAFILARLRLGIPLRWIQRLKWGQMEGDQRMKVNQRMPEAGGVRVRWQATGKRSGLPGEVWEAIRAALAAAGAGGECGGDAGFPGQPGRDAFHEIPAGQAAGAASGGRGRGRAS
jgi:hypothetical protein